MNAADSPPAASAAAMANAVGLVYVTDRDDGWQRQRTRSGFTYVDAEGRAIRDRQALERIRRLAIPPAYDNVWICADARGHLQATGRDARRRKQYRYHPEWRVVRDGAKFDRMAAFGAALPLLRRRLRKDLASPALTRAKVVATVVTLLDACRARVGNDAYARDNGSFGLTTLRNRHVEGVRGGKLRLRFRGKGGVEHEIAVDDARVARIVRHCHQLPGQRLFQYLDDDGELHPVDSGQVNDYLREVMGADFTAKDFRTWGATQRAVELLARVPRPAEGSEREAKAVIVDVVRRVAGELRNTPAVCRKSYINPVVFDAWHNGTFERLARQGAGRRGGGGESHTLALLRAAARETSAAKRGRNGRVSRVATKTAAIAAAL
ncbi:MAG TPA: DNA topoisomerase IB [Casimicrobiaceae bacterium]|nr:DNA topoisomerase IB [Casimicrobiaceae bacterium]